MKFSIAITVTSLVAFVAAAPLEGSPAGDAIKARHDYENYGWGGVGDEKLKARHDYENYGWGGVGNEKIKARHDYENYGWGWKEDDE